MTTRAAIYLRISLDAAMDGLAIDRQRQDCEALAEQRGWDVVHTYIDQSISASKKDVDRPDYDAMVASFERGEIDGFWDAKARSYFTVNRCHTSTSARTHAHSTPSTWAFEPTSCCSHRDYWVAADSPG